MEGSVLMPVPDRWLELERLVLEQIHRFKQPEKMSDADIFEHHLRHYRILTLYQELGRTKAVPPDDMLEELAWLQIFEKNGWKRPGPSD
jgi:hypothetical protein